MPTFIVRKHSASKDGSTLGSAQVLVTASDQATAKSQGAQQLGVPVSQVSVVHYADRIELNG